MKFWNWEILKFSQNANFFVLVTTRQTLRDTALKPNFPIPQFPNSLIPCHPEVTKDQNSPLPECVIARYLLYPEFWQNLSAMKKMILALLLSFPVLLFAQNIGIGTTTPMARLQINHQGNTTIGLQFADSGASRLGSIKFSSITHPIGMMFRAISLRHSTRIIFFDRFQFRPLPLSGETAPWA